MIGRVASIAVFLACAVFLAFATGAAAQSSNDCQTSLTVHGVALRGVAVCNPAWRDRPAARAILNMARPCLKRSDAESLARHGMEKFERDLKENGKDEACAALDGLLRKME